MTDEANVPEAQLDTLLLENRTFDPSAAFRRQANAKDGKYPHLLFFE